MFAPRVAVTSFGSDFDSGATALEFHQIPLPVWHP